MSEKQTNNPEVNRNTVQDLYQQCTNVFNTLTESVSTTMGHSATHVDLIQRVEVPAMNGKRVVLEWERPAKEDDPTAVDTNIPLEWYDETGKNHWHTPIGIKVYDEATGAELHDYSIARASHQLDEEPSYVWAFDYAVPTGPYSDDSESIMTALDANELIGQMEAALDGTVR